MKFLKYALILIFVTSCGPVIHYDFEKSTDFNQYKSYNYFDDMESGLSELDTKRLVRAIDARLATMGLTRSDNPDFYIDIQSQDIVNRSNSNVGVGVGGTGRNVGGGISIGVPLGNNQQMREIIIDFVDITNGEKLFWQAISESSYRTNASPEKREEAFIILVEKIFEGYPPKIKG